MSNVKKNNYPAIPEPTPDLKALNATCNALKEVVEILLGQRRNTGSAAVTYDRLVELQVITPQDVPR